MIAAATLAARISFLLIKITCLKKGFEQLKVTEGGVRRKLFSGKQKRRFRERSGAGMISKAGVNRYPSKITPAMMGITATVQAF
jgi:hypothetical protein